MDNRLVEQIKQRLPIAEVLSTYITLEPSGTQFKARCPFHSEKTASFSVSPERGFYYCFGCGAKGDVISFVQQFEGLDFKGTLKVLADRAGIVLTNQYAKTEPTDSVYAAMETATQKYQEYLKNNPEALAYLMKRGLTQDTIDQFRIGYAPTEWRNLAESLDVENQGYYERAGLIKKTDKGYYDRFRARIMFPMMDSSGRIVAFSGRRFPDTPADAIAKEGDKDVQEAPKYLNSPETEVFQKSRILFGFDKAKLAIKKHNFAILVEGQMDLVLSHQAGFKNTVATSGTAVSETVVGDASAQLSVMARLTPNLFLAFDGDSAGQKAMERAALVALSLGMNPKVVALPEGMDPADMFNEASHSAEASRDTWKELLKHAEHFIVHTLHAIQKTATSAHQLTLALRARLFPFLVRVPSAVERQAYLATIAAESTIGIKEITDDFNGYLATASVPSQDEAVALPAYASNVPITHLERFMAVTELFPSDEMAACKQSLADFHFEGAHVVFPSFEGDTRDRVIARVEREYSVTDHEQQIAIARELSQTIIAQFLEQLRFEYAMKMNEAKQQHDEEKELQYLALLQKLHQHRHST